MGKKEWEAYFDGIKRQDWASAGNALNKIVLTEKKNAQVHLKMGDVLQRMGDTPAAIASYHRSADLLGAQGFRQKALALYKIILRLDPLNEEAKRKTGLVMAEAGSARAPQMAPAAEKPLSSASGVQDRSGSSPEEQDISTPDIFSGIPSSELGELLGRLEVKSFSDGEKVVEEGDSGDSMFLVRSGGCRVVAHLLGRPVELARLGKGDIFGEVGFLTGRPRTAAVIAVGRLEVQELGRLDIERIIDRDPEVLARIEDFREGRVRDTIRKIKAK